ncbi:putative quinol monooxygenase [Blastococcus sp. SYSU D01042]
MSIVVVATITPRPEAVDAVREALQAAVPAVHEEPGCELYALHEADGSFVMVEKWADADAMKAHGKAEPLATLGAALAGKLAAAPDVRRLTALPAGDAGKGAV